MSAPEHVGFMRGGGMGTARSVPRPRFSAGAKLGLPSPVEFVLGPALAGLVTSVAWGGLARAVGVPWRLALAVAVLTGAFALVCTAVMVVADALEETEAVRDARAATHSELRKTACL